MPSENEALVLAAAKAAETMVKRNNKPLTKKSILSRLARLPRVYVEWLVTGLTRCGAWPLRRNEIAAMNKKELMVWVATVTGPATIFWVSFLVLFMVGLYGFGIAAINATVSRKVVAGGIKFGVVGAITALGLRATFLPIEAAVKKLKMSMPKSGKMSRFERMKSGCMFQIPLANMANKRARKQILKRARGAN